MSFSIKCRIDVECFMKLNVENRLNVVINWNHLSFDELMLLSSTNWYYYRRRTDAIIVDELMLLSSTDWCSIFVRFFLINNALIISSERVSAAFNSKNFDSIFSKKRRVSDQVVTMISSIDRWSTCFRSSRLCDRFFNQLTSIDRWSTCFRSSRLCDRFFNQLTSTDRWSTCFRSRSRLCDRFSSQLNDDVFMIILVVFMTSSIDRWRRFFDQVVFYDRFSNRLTLIDRWSTCFRSSRLYDRFSSQLIFKNTQFRADESVSLSFWTLDQ